MLRFLIFNLIISAVANVILTVYSIIFLSKSKTFGKKITKQKLEFLLSHSKLLLILSIICIAFCIISIICYVLLVTQYNQDKLDALFTLFPFIKLIPFSIMVSIVPLITFIRGYLLPKLRKDISSELHIELGKSINETATTVKTDLEQEKCKAEEWLKYKTDQEQKQREYFWEQQRKEREEQERRNREKQEREQKSMEYFIEHKFSLVTTYQDTVFNFIEKLTENYPYLFLKMFKDTDIPMSSILVKPYYGKSKQTETQILFDGLKFTEAADSNMNEKIQELTNFFIQGLKKRIQDNGDYDDEFTFPVLLYYIVRNNVIKYYRNEYIETYGYESFDEFCDHISNPFEQEKTNFKVLDDILTISHYMSNNAITEYVYYYIYENNIDLPFVDTYKKIVLDMKQIFERKKKEKLENELFGKQKKRTVAVNDAPHTLSPIDRIDRMTGEQFEIFMEDYFRKQGFKVERTPLSGDYGIDLIIENDFSKIGVQAKCYSNKVTLSAVQEVATGLRHYGLSSGMVVTNNYFQPSAIQLAKDNNITLWNRDKLIEKLGK